MKRLMALMVISGVLLAGCGEVNGDVVDISETTAPPNKESEVQPEKTERDVLLEDVRVCVNPSYRGAMYSVGIKLEDEEYIANVVMDSGVFADENWAGLAALGLIRDMKVHNAESSEKISSYNFEFYANGVNTFKATFDNTIDISEEVIKSNEMSIAIQKPDGEVVAENTAKDYNSDKADAKPLQEDKQEDKSITRKPELKSHIESRINEGNYGRTTIQDIAINNNAAENETYIALVKLNFNTKNGRDRANTMMRMYSDDLAATLADKGIQDIAELTVFWRDDYNNRDLKYNYGYRSGNFYLQDVFGE